ncbi:MAG TPA: DnaJ C-terminal domain-containing protein [Polyangiaceae bacterium]|nr:DnaJ C-terminal domain-containing protein [Polyangiaceae bacterium]
MRSSDRAPEPKMSVRSQASRRSDELVGLGGLIVTRQKDFVTRVVFTLLWLPGMLVGLAYALFLGPALPWGLPRWLTPVLGIPVLLVGGARVLGVIFRSVEFHHEALVDRVLFARRVIRYEDVSDLDLSLIRQYLNFSYVRTLFRLRLRLTDGRLFDFKDTYLGDHDRIHAVRGRISEVIAQSEFARAQHGAPLPESLAVAGQDVQIGAELSLWNAMVGGKYDALVRGNAACEACSGMGRARNYVCSACAGQGVVERQRRVLVAYPAGIESGQTLRVPGLGMPGLHGGSPGDLYLNISIKPHPRFDRQGADLQIQLQISAFTASQGGQLEIVLPNSETVSVNIPVGTRPGIIKVEGEGMPRLGLAGRGDLLVVVALEGVAVPN